MQRLGLILAFAIACGGDDSGRMNPVTSVTTTLGGSTGDDSSGSMPSTGSDEDPGTTTDDPMTTTSGDPSTSPEDTGPPPTGVSCNYTCSVAADCLAGGMTYGHTCQTGKCVIPCTNPDGCVAYYSGWLIEPCRASADCEFNTCVAYGDGFGGCAFTPELGACADLGLQEAERMTVEGDTVTVCAQPNAACSDLGAGMECSIPCTDFSECYMRQTGEECTAAGECVYTCVAPGDCPASNFDNVVPSCE